MVGVYMGGVYGGSRTAILLNIPGAPSAIATAFDGFPLAQKGEAGQADWAFDRHVCDWRLCRHHGVVFLLPRRSVWWPFNYSPEITS
ncbi:tripartite tricarboxylate transporter permease [Vibrio sp. PP-XX7]